MNDNKQRLRHLMLFNYRKGKNAIQTTKEICDFYGCDAIINERTVQKWFKRFRGGDFSLDDKKRSGRPIKVDDDEIATLVGNKPCCTTREIAEILKISHKAVALHLKKLGMVAGGALANSSPPLAMETVLIKEEAPEDSARMVKAESVDADCNSEEELLRDKPIEDIHGSLDKFLVTELVECDGD